MNRTKDSTEDFHFYASSIAEWVTTTDTRTLPDVIERMDNGGFPYRLWLVPGNWQSNYTIEHYAPKVEGIQFLGYFETPKKRRAEARRIEKEKSLGLDKELWGTKATA